LVHVFAIILMAKRFGTLSFGTSALQTIRHHFVEIGGNGDAA